MKQVLIRKAGDREESLHRALVRFQVTIPEDVLNRHAAFIERTTHQKRSMAVQRFSLRTHQSNVMLVRAADNTLDPSLEQLSARDAVVLNAAVLITGLIFRPTTELATEKDVLD